MLIDCDMRRPAVAKIFDAEVEEGTGLSDLLAGDSTLKDVMRRDSRYKYLRCVFQNKAIAEPDKLLEDEAFKTLLRKIASRMDYVILDTPPLGIVRDAEIISAAADSVLLVIRQDLVHASEINDAVDVLDETGVTCLLYTSDMLTAYYSCACDSEKLFEGLEILSLIHICSLWEF